MKVSAPGRLRSSRRSDLLRGESVTMKSGPGVAHVSSVDMTHRYPPLTIVHRPRLGTMGGWRRDYPATGAGVRVGGQQLVGRSGHARGIKSAGNRLHSCRPLPESVDRGASTLWFWSSGALAGADWSSLPERLGPLTAEVGLAARWGVAVAGSGSWFLCRTTDLFCVSRPISYGGLERTVDWCLG
jgi:hypothetical protein